MSKRLNIYETLLRNAAMTYEGAQCACDAAGLDYEGRSPNDALEEWLDGEPSNREMQIALYKIGFDTNPNPSKMAIKTEILQMIIEKIDNEYCTLGDEIIAGKEALLDPERRMLRFIGSIYSLPSRLQEMKKMAEAALEMAKLEME